MPSSTHFLAVALLLVACGDNGGGTTPTADGPPPMIDGPVGPRCEPPPTPLPTDGPLRDPAAFELAGCVTGGLRDLPGRWFNQNPGSLFTYDYPRFAGSCEEGFRRSPGRTDDHDGTDGSTYHTWSDGTRFFARSYRRFPPEGEPDFERVSGFVACMTASGELAGAFFSHTTDLGDRIDMTVGRRFSAKDGPSQGLVELGSLATTPDDFPIIGYNVVVDAGVAYVIGPFGLDTIDVSDPTAPVHLAHIEADFNDIKIVRGNGRVVAYAAPLFSETTAIIDVTDPANPIVTGQINEWSHSVFVEQRGTQQRLYLANYTETVPVFNVTNPLAPVRLGDAVIPGVPAGVHDLYVDGNTMFLNYTTEGFVALDITGGLGNAVERARVPTSYSHASWAGTVAGRRIVLHGDEGMTPSDGGSFLRVLDADPTSATFMNVIGQYQSRREVGIHNIQLVGDRAYIAYYQDGVRVVDLADPTQPTEVAHFNTWDAEAAPGFAFEGAIGIRVVGGLIYVADSERGLIILEEP